MRDSNGSGVESLRKRTGRHAPLALVAGDELDRRIREGWDEWCELVDELTSTGGTLPSRQLAGRVIRFFEDSYWRAEQAHDEVLRRELGPGQPTPRTTPVNTSPIGLGI